MLFQFYGDKKIKQNVTLETKYTPKKECICMKDTSLKEQIIELFKKKQET